MSASLVGSEMCIRDRPPLARSRARIGSLDRTGPPPLFQGGRFSRRGGAVSYTHLTLPTICSV
eukprot:12506191-Alexandrium_andersonii.AAC.1